VVSTSTEILYESKSDNSVKVGSRLNNSSDASQNDSLSLAQLNTNLQQPQMEK
jgi:hypothetical protein